MSENKADGQHESVEDQMARYEQLLAALPRGECLVAIRGRPEGFAVVDVADPMLEQREGE